jgi:hypothetical protein
LNPLALPVTDLVPSATIEVSLPSKLIKLVIGAQLSESKEKSPGAPPFDGAPLALSVCPALTPPKLLSILCCQRLMLLSTLFFHKFII